MTCVGTNDGCPGLLLHLREVEELWVFCFLAPPKTKTPTPVN